MIPFCGRKKNSKEKRLVDKILKSNKTSFEKYAEKFVESMDDGRTNRLHMELIKKRMFQFSSHNSIPTSEINNIIRLMNLLIMQSTSGFDLITHCLDISSIIIEYIVNYNTTSNYATNYNQMASNNNNNPDIQHLLIQTLTKIFMIDEKNKAQREYLSVVQFISLNSKIPLQLSTQNLKRDSLKCLDAWCCKVFEELTYIDTNVIIISTETCICCINELTQKVSPKLVDCANECLKLSQVIFTRIIKFSNYAAIQISKCILDALFDSSHNFISSSIFCNQLICFSLDYMTPQYRCIMLTLLPKYIENMKWPSDDHIMNFILLYSDALKKFAPFDNNKHQLSIIITMISFFINIMQIYDPKNEFKDPHTNEKNKNNNSNNHRIDQNLTTSQDKKIVQSKDSDDVPTCILKCFKQIIGANNIIPLDRTTLQLWDNLLEEARMQNLKNYPDFHPKFRNQFHYLSFLHICLEFEKPKYFYEALNVSQLSKIINFLSIIGLHLDEATTILDYLIKRFDYYKICPKELVLSNDFEKSILEKSLKKYHNKTNGDETKKSKTIAHNTKKLIVEKTLTLFKIIVTLNSILSDKDATLLSLRVLFLAILHLSAIKDNKLLYLLCFLVRLQSFVINQKSIKKSLKENSICLIHTLLSILSILMRCHKLKTYFNDFGKMLPKIKSHENWKDSSNNSLMKYDIEEISQLINKSIDLKTKIKNFPRFKDILVATIDVKSLNTSMQVSFQNTIDSNGWISHKAQDQSIESNVIDDLNSSAFDGLIDNNNNNNNNNNHEDLPHSKTGPALSLPNMTSLISLANIGQKQDEVMLNPKAIFSNINTMTKFKDNADLMYELKEMTLA